MSKGQELFDIMKSFEQGDIDEDMANGAIRAVLNNGTSASAVDTIVNWRCVDEQLPDDFRVLVPIKGIHVAIAYFINGKFWRDYDAWYKKGVDEIEDNKYWLPLPKPKKAN